GTEKLDDISADVFQNDSLTPEKMSFFKNSKNLYNKETSHQDYSINAINGKLTSSTGNVASDFIEVEGNQYYSLSPESGQAIRIAFYDSYQNYISGLSDPTNPILTPEETRFVRYSIWVGSSDIENVRQFEKGTEATPYEPFYENAFDVDYIRNNTIPPSKIQGGLPSGDVSQSADEIIVDMQPKKITFYIKGTNSDSNRYLKYSFTKETREFDETRDNG